MLTRLPNGLKTYCMRISYGNFARSTALRSLSSARRDVKWTQAHYEVKNNVAIFRYNSPNSKMNSINEPGIDEMYGMIKYASTDPDVKAIVFSSAKPGCFVAGADLKWLEAYQHNNIALHFESINGQMVLTDIEDCYKPVVAAIQGVCFGGGLEIAMVCHYRVALDNPKTVFALPEFQLGIIPGCGATQRLHKLIPWLQALDMTLTGRTVRLDQAKKWGLVDKVVPPLDPSLIEVDDRSRQYLEDAAVKTALDLAEGRLKIQRKKPLKERLFDRALQFAPFRNYVFQKAKSTVLKKTHGLYPGPLRILEVFRTTVEKGSKAGFEAEFKAFGDLFVTNESRALRSLFHGSTRCKKNRFGEPKREVKNLAVLGAGLMGTGIAQVSLMQNLNVVLTDTTKESTMKGEQQIRKALDKYVEKREITNVQREHISSRLKTSLSNEGFAKCDMVIEAVPEDLELKRRILKEVEAVTPDHCIFATNTSAIPLAEIVQASKRPEKFIGMHYFSPVEKMQLLEIVTTDKTSEDTIASAVELGIKQGKIPIVVKDCPGFYTTRLAGTLYSEGGRMLQEGEDPKKLDKLCKAAGFPFGIVSLYDEIGLDVALHVGRNLEKAYGARLGGANLQGVADMVAKGYLGRKSGKGFFLYSENSKDRQVNTEAVKMLLNYRQSPKGFNTPEDIKLRLITRFANEAVRCLQENVLDNPVEGDIGAVFGLGYPPFTGGPFRYTDTFGAGKLVAQLEKYQTAYGASFEPCQLLKDYAKSGKKFYNKDLSPIY